VRKRRTPSPAWGIGLRTPSCNSVSDGASVKIEVAEARSGFLENGPLAVDLLRNVGVAGVKRVDQLA